MTDERALKLAALMGLDVENATEADFRNAFQAAVAINMQMQACSDVWSEFRDVSSFMAQAQAAAWRAGEIKRLVTPQMRTEADAMIAMMDDYRRSGLATLSTQSDREQCWLMAQGYRMMESTVRAALD